MSADPQKLIVTFRDTLRRVTPPWLQNGLAQKILYAVAVQLDAGGDAIVAGVKIRFPGLYSDDSLPLIGRERRIRRGLSEPSSNYATRLTRWWSDHKVRGGAYALLQQLWYHYQPNNFEIVLWYPSGARYLLAVDGTITRSLPTTYLPVSQWAKWTLLYFSDEFTAEDEADLVLIPREWIAAHCFGEIIVMPTGAELWDYPPSETWNGAGTWNTADTSIRMTVR